MVAILLDFNKIFREMRGIFMEDITRRELLTFIEENTPLVKNYTELRLQYCNIWNKEI